MRHHSGSAVRLLSMASSRQHLVRLLLTTLLLGSCSAPVAHQTKTLAAHTAPVAARTYFAAMTPKNAAAEFLNRLATPTGQLVVTADDITGHGLRLTVAADEDLYIVETQLAGAATLPGEINRLDSFAFVTATKGQSVHLRLGRHDLFATKVGERLRTASASLSGLKNLPAVSIDADKAVAAAAKTSRLDIDIDQAYLEQKLKEFSGAVPTQIAGRPVTITERGSITGRERARAWLQQEYEALGYTVILHDYSGSSSSFAGGANFVAQRPGADPSRYLIVSAHIDSVSNAGADDDGSGVISALAVAHALRDQALAVSLRIVGFDEEERGLLGSDAYARYLSSMNSLNGLIGVINLEMTAYDSDNDGAFHAIDCNENTSAMLTAQIQAAMAQDAMDLEIVPACTNRSDHAVFWSYDKPAIVVSQNFFGGDSNPCYHRACDRTNRSNFDYMRRITTVIARSVAALVVRQ